MKERRIALSLKQEDAANRAGINLRTFQYFEQTGKINLSKLLKLFILYRMDTRIINCIVDRSWWTLEELERSESRKKVR
jgi:DNA-binding XRE family transcriptional regulator